MQSHLVNIAVSVFVRESRCSVRALRSHFANRKDEAVVRSNYRTLKPARDHIKTSDTLCPAFTAECNAVVGIGSVEACVIVLQAQP